MSLHVIITDLLPNGDCELTGKSGVECVRARFDESTPEAVICSKEFMRVVRFRKTQQDKLDARGASRNGKDDEA